MNPARSFGPALVANEWRDFWVYILGPLIGATVGAFAYQLVRGEHRDQPLVPSHQEG
jgi:glycerol uptake facilitator-like aquaporin